jgi:hypothetical protein
VGEPGRLGTEGLVEFDMLGGVGEVILATDYVGDLHLDVIDDAYEVEDPGAIRTAKSQIGMGAGIREVELDLSADLIVDDNLLPRGAEADGAIVLVKVAGFFEACQILLIDRPTLALVVGTVIPPLLRTFVPIEPEPVKPVEDHLLGFLGIARVVGILDAEDKGAGVFAGVDPVEEGGAGSPYMEKAGGRGGESCADRALRHLNIRIHLLGQLKRVASEVHPRR